MRGAPSSAGLSRAARRAGDGRWQEARQEAGGQDEEDRRPEARLEALPLVERAREDRAGEAAAGVGHVVEADVHRDLVAVGVGEDQVGVDGGVQREDDAEGDQAADHDDGRVDVGGERDRDAGREGGEHEGEPGRGPAVGLGAVAPPRPRMKRGAEAWTMP